VHFAIINRSSHRVFCESFHSFSLELSEPFILHPCWLLWVGGGGGDGAIPLVFLELILHV